MPNHDIFDEWNETSAYTLGFWYADGHIEAYAKRGRRYKRFALSNTDKELMDFFAMLFDVGTNKTGSCHRIAFHSEKLFDFCYSITGTVQKSKQGHMPIVPSEVFSHFVRGFFDGDGSIHYVTYRNRHGNPTTELRTSFTAGRETGDFLESLKQKIRDFVPVGDRQVVLSGTGKKLMFTQYDSALLCEWMYHNSNVYMQRKKRIWDSADKDRLLRSKKFFSNKV